MKDYQEVIKAMCPAAYIDNCVVVDKSALLVIVYGVNYGIPKLKHRQSQPEDGKKMQQQQHANSCEEHKQPLTEVQGVWQSGCDVARDVIRSK